MKKVYTNLLIKGIKGYSTRSQTTASFTDACEYVWNEPEESFEAKV